MDENLSKNNQKKLGVKENKHITFAAPYEGNEVWKQGNKQLKRGDKRKFKFSSIKSC